MVPMVSQIADSVQEQGRRGRFQRSAVSFQPECSDFRFCGLWFTDGSSLIADY